MNNDTPQDADMLDTSGPAPGIFESMGMTPVSAQSLSLLTPQEPSSTSGGGDRELLERAAKAARLTWLCWDDARHGMKMHPGQACGSRWNPLDDDGDALRLAITIGMILDVRYTDAGMRKFNRVNFWPNRTTTHASIDLGEHDDPAAATRRAIVRAAASLTNPTEVSP